MDKITDEQEEEENPNKSSSQASAFNKSLGVTVTLWTHFESHTLLKIPNLLGIL